MEMVFPPIPSTKRNVLPSPRAWRKSASPSGWTSSRRADGDSTMTVFEWYRLSLCGFPEAFAGIPVTNNAAKNVKGSAVFIGFSLLVHLWKQLPTAAVLDLL